MPKSNMPKHDWSRCLQLLVGPKRPKQNDKNNMMKVCMQETESVMSALHSVAEAQLSPACRPRARPAPGRKCVCVWNAAGRKKKVLKLVVVVCVYTAIHMQKTTTGHLMTMHVMFSEFMRQRLCTLCFPNSCAKDYLTAGGCRECHSSAANEDGYDIL